MYALIYHFIHYSSSFSQPHVQGTLAVPLPYTHCGVECKMVGALCPGDHSPDGETKFHLNG